MLKPSSTNVI
uniref:Uncharacterized protein n=1 Tax=Anguilla anguilla TaxID=7936 RepID=A0A0E9SNZ5_ANGAN